MTVRDETRQPLVVAREPIAATATEHEALVAFAAFLARQGARSPHLVGADDESVALPASIYRLLDAAVRELVLDNAVTLVPSQQELTTQQAAAVLNISRPFLIQLLERGELPYTRVGTHRRLKIGDVVTYRQRRALAEEAALDELARDGFDLGL